MTEDEFQPWWAKSPSWGQVSWFGQLWPCSISSKLGNNLISACVCPSFGHKDQSLRYSRYVLCYQFLEKADSQTLTVYWANSWWTFSSMGYREIQNLWLFRALLVLGHASDVFHGCLPLQLILGCCLWWKHYWSSQRHADVFYQASCVCLRSVHQRVWSAKPVTTITQDFLYLLPKPHLHWNISPLLYAPIC